jgi:rhodanese-related sulfurtransferase
MQTVSVHDLKQAIADATVIDVREPEEYQAGHVPGARLVPLATVPQHVGDLPTDQPVYVVCASGNRSGRAAEFLAQQGIDARNVDGGTGDWIAAGYDVET